MAAAPSGATKEPVLAKAMPNFMDRQASALTAGQSRRVPRSVASGRPQRRRGAWRCCSNCRMSSSTTAVVPRTSWRSTGSTWPSARARPWRSWGRPGPASRPCCTWPEASTCPTRGTVTLDGRDLAGLGVAAAGPVAAARDRLRVPVLPPAAQPDRGRERRAAPAARRPSRPGGAHRGGGRCSTGSGSATGPTTFPASCRAGSCSGRPSPGRWWATRVSCSPTSPPATSTRPPVGRCSTCSRRSCARRGRAS